MLSLYALLFVLIFSCSSAKSDDKTFSILQEGLDNSTRSITRSSSLIYSMLDEKQHDPVLSERAAIWLPKAALVRQLSGNMAGYIDSVRATVVQEHGIKAEQARRLYQRLEEYKAGLLQIDTLMAHTFSGSMTLVTPAFDSLDSEPQDFALYFFDRSATAPTLALLSRFENNIRVIENRMILFCNEQVVSTMLICDFVSAIVSQSSHHVKAGESIEIKAGIGAFTVKNNNTQITIDGRTASLNEEGVAVYTLKSPARPGIYSVPVKIMYTDEENKQQWITSRIKYTVDEPCSPQ